MVSLERPRGENVCRMRGGQPDCRPDFRCLALAAHERLLAAVSGSLKLAALLTIGAGLAIGIYSTLRERLDETTLQLRTKELERERALKLATEAQLGFA